MQLQLHRHVLAIQRHCSDVVLQLLKQSVMACICKGSRLEIGGQANEQDVCLLLRGAECLRIGRAQGHEIRIKPIPNLRGRKALRQRHITQGRNTTQVRQRRHIHDRQTRHALSGRPRQQIPDAVGTVLRLLHRERDKIISGGISLFGRHRVNFTRQIARGDCTVAVLIAQLQFDHGAFAVDQNCRCSATHKRHVMAGHQQFCSQKRAVGGPQDQDLFSHG